MLLDTVDADQATAVQWWFMSQWEAVNYAQGNNRHCNVAPFVQNTNVLSILLSQALLETRRGSLVNNRPSID